MVLHQVDSFLGKILTAITSLNITADHRFSALASLIEPLKKFAIGPLNPSQAVSFRPDYHIPINQATVVMAHNAYNMPTTGLSSVLPNHQSSIEGLLNMGVRALELDVYSRNDDFFLCHRWLQCRYQKTLGFGVDWLFGTNLRFSEVLKKIVSFQNNNPNEAIIIKLEDHVDEEKLGIFAKLIEKTCGHKIFTFDDLTNYIAKNGVWPSFSDISNASKPLILMTENLNAASQAQFPMFINTPHSDPLALNNYYSVYQAVNDGLANIPRFNNQTIEIGEDGSLILGGSRNILRHIPIINNLIHDNGGGQFTKETIHRITQQGVGGKKGAIIGLDNIQEHDYRFVEGGLLVNMRENSCYFIPRSNNWCGTISRQPYSYGKVEKI